MRKFKFIISVFMLISLLILAGCTSETSGNQESETPAATPAATQYETQSTTPSATETETTSKTFTLEELKAYDGQNGNPAYIAVDGVVYDVTNVKAWKNGKHNGQTAGNDLTDEIGNAPHGTSVLKDLPVVGTLKMKMF